MGNISHGHDQASIFGQKVYVTRIKKIARSERISATFQLTTFKGDPHETLHTWLPEFKR